MPGTQVIPFAERKGLVTLQPRQQLGSCSVTRPFLSAKGMACETTWPMARKLTAGYFAVWILSKTGI